jgi:hypothetical protein
MGKAIAVMTMIVMCSFAFVVLHLTLRKPAGASNLRGPGPLLEVREDGSIAAVDVQMSLFEQRLIDAEKRSLKLEQELEAARKDREELETRVTELQGEVRRLRRPTVPPRPRPDEPEIAPESPTANAPANAPAPQPVNPGVQ